MVLSWCSSARVCVNRHSDVVDTLVGRSRERTDNSVCAQVKRAGDMMRLQCAVCCSATRVKETKAVVRVFAGEPLYTLRPVSR